ncbi:MAG: DUF4079 family protein [Thermodesulfobacteriota bacterium]
MDPQTIALLRYAHGAFNLTVFLCVMVLARFGFRVRKGRLSGQTEPGVTRNHRRMGPVVLGLVWTGYTAGTMIIVLDKGRIFEFPYHALGGLLLAILTTSTFLVSKRMTPTSVDLRNIHYRLGRTILVLFAAQVLLGVGILL